MCALSVFLIFFIPRKENSMMTTNNLPLICLVCPSSSHKLQIFKPQTVYFGYNGLYFFDEHLIGHDVDLAEYAHKVMSSEHGLSFILPTPSNIKD